MKKYILLFVCIMVAQISKSQVTPYKCVNQELSFRMAGELCDYGCTVEKYNYTVYSGEIITEGCYFLINTNNTDWLSVDFDKSSLNRNLFRIDSAIRFKRFVHPDEINWVEQGDYSYIYKRTYTVNVYCKRDRYSVKYHVEVTYEYLKGIITMYSYIEK